MTTHPPIDSANVHHALGKTWEIKYKRQFHGRIKEPEYESWCGMKYRCSRPSCKDYPHYGGRGITYDPRWEDFMEFFKDMGPSPGREYTLERKDFNGPYCKDNCIWLLKNLQNRNQRTNKLSMEKAREIRALYAAGGTSYRRLAIKFGVAASLIGFVVQNKKWKEP